MNKSLLGASLVALALAAPAAHAYQAGDMILRAGAITTAPNESSGDLKFDGNKVSGTKATLDSDTQLGLTFATCSPTTSAWSCWQRPRSSTPSP